MLNWVVFLISLMIHEAFHILTGYFFFGGIIRPSLTPAGFRASWDKIRPDCVKQLIICASGPFGNITVSVILYLIPADTELIKGLIRANIFTGIFNLIPLYPMDGGNILLTLLYKNAGSGKAYLIMKKTGQYVRFFMLAAGIYILVDNLNPSLLLTVIFLPGAGALKRSVNRMNLNALIRRKERILKKRAYPVRHVLTLKSVGLGEAILLLDYDRYHIIHIANEELEVVRVITEKQLLDAIIALNSSMTLEEAFNL